MRQFKPADIGRRVSVRLYAPDVVRPDGRPRFRDVVGTLVAVGDAAWRVRRRDGTEVTIDLGQVAAARVVEQRPTRLRRARDVDPATLEQIAAEGWQPLESEALGDWVLRAANGFTGRANSVLALGDPDRDWSAAFDDVARWYTARQLIPTFQVPLPLAAELDDRLEAAGWTVDNPVSVQVVDILGALTSVEPRNDLPSIRYDPRPSEQWTSTYRYRGAVLPTGAAAVLANADAPVFALAMEPETPPVPVAVARGALTPGWLGITAVDVVEGARRRGLGGHLVRGLLSYAHDRGARFAYLQVAEHNTAARALYEQFGFVEHHRYHYRRLR